MSKSCPASPDVIDERAARVVALFVLPLLSSALLLNSAWPAVLLAVDFGLRGLGLRRLSPLGLLAQRLLVVLGGQMVKVNAGPKQFAAKLGFVFSLLIAVGLAARVFPATYLVAGGLAVCAALEGLFGFCVGCRIYQLLPHAGTRAAQPTR